MTAHTLGLDQELGEIAHSLRQSTVLIQGPDGASGSGVLWNGRGYAVPTALVSRFLSRQAEQPYLGMTLKPVEGEFSEPTVTWMITQVMPGSPAAQAGLVVGDRLLGINGRLFRQPSDLTDWLDCLVPGQTLALQISQGGQRVICTLTVGQLPLQEQAA